MCLYSRQILPRRATKDIIVYKEILQFDNLKKIYKTPFARYYISLSEFGNIKSAEGFIEIFRHTASSIHTEIGRGYFHCHRIMPLLKGMGRYGRYYTNNIPCGIKYNSQWRIVECIIPKGSLYWIGVRNDICSDRLIFNKVLSEEEINQILYKQ